MTVKSDDGGVVDTANEMYWESSASVNQIAERMDLSKGSLYSMIRPLPAEVPCPGCGSEMAYPNRTALEKGFLVCSECGFEEEEDVVRGVEPEGEKAPLGNSFADLPAEGGQGEFPTRVVAGVALLGVAAGLVIARSLRSR
jgi:predicted RNA-binding Zn-ribbon protein involved in translation (DUF1610 family)